MNFTNVLQLWLKGELLQGKIMIAFGVLLLLIAIAIFRGQNELLRGALIPLSLVVVVLIGYGGYILQSRPAHVDQSLAMYDAEPKQAVAKEVEKHTTDNQAGNTLIRIYPILAIISLIALMLVPSLFFKGMALGFAFLFMTAFILDMGFVTRSNGVIHSLSNY